MIQNDLHSIKRCFDLKGSTFLRHVKLDPYEEATKITKGKVLKDINFKRDFEKTDKCGNQASFHTTRNIKP